MKNPNEFNALREIAVSAGERLKNQSHYIDVRRDIDLLLDYIIELEKVGEDCQDYIRNQKKKG